MGAETVCISLLHTHSFESIGLECSVSDYPFLLKNVTLMFFFDGKSNRKIGSSTDFP